MVLEGPTVGEWCEVAEEGRVVVILIAFDLREKRRERVVPANDHGEVPRLGGD